MGESLFSQKVSLSFFKNKPLNLNNLTKSSYHKPDFQFKNNI